MSNRTSTSILAALVAISALGCDTKCDKTVEEVATIQNLTNSPLALTFCKGSHSYLGNSSSAWIPVGANLTSDPAVREFGLGSHQSAEIRGGPSSLSCSGVREGKESTPISLSEESFGQVTLCTDSANNKNIIIENNQACPDGYAEQTSQGPCST